MADGIYPAARQRLLPEADRQPGMIPTQLILHTIVGSAEGAYNFFLKSSPLESHLIVPWNPPTWQLVPCTHSADANRKANRRPDGTGAISVETEDDGTPEDTPWTDAQLDQIVDLGVWAANTYGIPVRRCPDPDAPGFGYHTMFGAPSAWTPVAKTCPGKARIAQFPAILDAIKRRVTPPVPELPHPSTEEDIVYVRDSGTGTIWALTNTTCLPLTGPEWAYRVEHEQADKQLIPATTLQVVAMTYVAGRVNVRPERVPAPK